MKKIIVFILLNVNLNVFCQYKFLSINPKYPEQNKSIILKYSGKLVNSKTKISLIFCTENNYYFPEKILVCKIVNNQMVCNFKIPKNALYFNVKIQNKGEFDNNNGNGFGFNIYKNGIPIKGTFFAEGYFAYMSRRFFNGNFDSLAALRNIEKDYLQNPEIIEETKPYYIQTLSRISSKYPEAIKLSKKCFTEILKNGENEKYSAIYTSVISRGNFKIRDSLNKIILDTFPFGYNSNNNKLNLIQKNIYKNLDSASNIIDQVSKQKDNLSINQKNRLEELKAAYYANKKDFKKLDSLLKRQFELDKFFHVIPEISSNLNDIAWGLVQKNEEMDRAFETIKIVMDIYNKYDTLSIYYGNACDTYANILSKRNRIREAIFYQRKAVSARNYIVPDINEKLIQYLMDDRQYITAKKAAEEFIKDNYSNAKIDSLYKVATNKISENNKGVNKSFEKIKNTAQENFAVILRKKIINKDASEFELKDLNGKTVKLNDYKGYILIIDFWATWCKPCIASFPALKELMSEFKDKQVKFLFINTLEVENFSNNKEKLIEFMNLKNLEDLHVLIDEKTEFDFKVKSSYNIESIPTKFIIDRSGKLRYKSNGFENAESLKNEIKTVIRIIDN